MGQQLFKAHFEINDNFEIDSDTISSITGQDDISYFFPSKSSDIKPHSHEFNNNDQNSHSHIESIKRTRHDLSLLTKLIKWEEINSEINDILMNNVFNLLVEQNKQIIKDVNERLTYTKQLQTSFMKKLKDDTYNNISIFAQSCIVNSSDDTATETEDDKNKKSKLLSKQLSYLGIQSLSSILLVLIKSAEKNDPVIVNEILTLTSELCEQLPMKCLSSDNIFLFKSLKPLTNYIQQLTLASDPIISKQATKILLSFFVAKGSFKDILSLLNKLVFNTNDIYLVHGLIIQLNDGFTKNLNELEKLKQSSNSNEKLDADFDDDTETTPEDLSETLSIDYLKSTGTYPNTELLNLNEQTFTGEFISSILLSHIDIENRINTLTKNYQLNSFACEFHPNTFTYLFNIIEQISMVSQPNKTLNYILVICLRLFTTHLKILSDIKNDESLDLKDFLINDQLTKWFDLLLKLACNDDSEQSFISEEASKAFIHVINIKSSLFVERLTFIHQYIVENKHTTLIKKFLIELNNHEILSMWIDNLSNESHEDSLLKILYSFIDLYFNRNDSYKSSIEKILLSFQHFLIIRLINQSEKKILTNNELQLSSLTNEYLTYIFKHCLPLINDENNLFNSILIGLCLMTKVNEILVYEALQPIFITILPLLAEYYLNNLSHPYRDIICYLIGKISYVLIIGSPQDYLEIKHNNQLKLPIFYGGYRTNKCDHLVNSNLAVYTQYELPFDSQDDQDFLMSIYNNTDEAEKLISKLKTSAKHKQRILQKSIEKQVNDAVAAVFAVYIKFYRRINLAKYELLQTEQVNPHSKLLSIYDYANHVFTLFSTIKAQGGDCDELLKQIKMKAYFLLSSVKESNLIPIINERVPTIIINTTPKDNFKNQRQKSRWTKAQNVIKLLRNLFQACIRFKKFMKAKEQSQEQKFNVENLLQQAIDNFLYEDFYKTSTSIKTEERQLKITELEKCLSRQHERAITRVITYRFIRKFLQDILNRNDNNLSLMILSICLPYLKENDLEWSYLDKILATNNQLKEEISNNYYLILKLVLPVSLKTKSLLQNVFYLLNLPYGSMDLCHLYQYDFIQTFFNSFISLNQNSQCDVSLDLQFISFNWFRLYVFKLCENIAIEKEKDTFNELLEKQEKLVFNTLILNELKQTCPTNSQDENVISLKNKSFSWFIRMNETKNNNNESTNSCTQNIELYKNQYLVLLLQCNYYYKIFLSICANIDYLNELLNIYYHSQSNLTRLLTIKLLRYLIPLIKDTIDGRSRNFIEKFLTDVLNSIGEKVFPQEILSELIYMYRTIMSMNSSWRIVAKDLIMNSIKSFLNLQSIELNNSKEINQLLASLSILGEHIEPYRLGSMVTVNTNKKSNDETSLGLIIEIDNENTEKSFVIQYLQTNQIENVSIDQLQVEIDVLPSNLSNIDDSFLDILGDFIQIDTSSSKSLVLLELKRRSMSVLYNILNESKVIELFMKKPYASTIAKLCLSNSLENIRQKLPDLDLLTKEDFERYSLTLNQCEQSESIIKDETTDNQLLSTNDEDHSSYFTWTNSNFTPDSTILNIITKSISTSNPWNSYATEIEMDYFKQGRSGADELSIVPMPIHVASFEAIQECGNKHKFRGRIAPSSETTHVGFPTFIVDNLQLSKGKWYYCVRLPLGGTVQIGWATNGMSPNASCGVGDDRYSWSYDGSRAAFFYEDGFYGQYDNVHWQENDVCGCGIEIDGKNTKINYWLNGKFLGTAFQHDTLVPLSVKRCDLLPNGPDTTYFPAVTIQYSIATSRSCELIFSPEDMQGCPLPNDYKPLLLPKYVPIENLIVDYPFNAYLIGENSEDYLHSTRTNPSNICLRDFINEHHIEMKYSIDDNDHCLNLPDQSSGFPLLIDNTDMKSLTISFDFQILSSNDKSDVLLFEIDSNEVTMKCNDQKVQCVIIFLAKKRQIKLYINNKCRIFLNAFKYETIQNLSLQLLPKISAKIKNLAIWKYALSEDDIQRLFTYGLTYISTEYQRLKDFHKQINQISFSKHQKVFLNEYLIPFNEPFTENIWLKKKTQSDDNEFNYFKSDENIDYSVVELYGNQTYLVLDKSNNDWDEYTFILTISILNLPNTNEKLTLIALNPKSEVYITEEGKICFETNGTKQESNSMIILNEYFNLFISVQRKNIRIYLNNNLEIDMEGNVEQFHIKSNRIDLFRETDLKKNTTNENTNRISLKSLTYLNRTISIDHRDLSSLMTPSFLIIASNLIAMGYKKSWITSIMKQYKTTHIPTIHKILGEQKEQLIKGDLENERKRYLTIFSKLNPSVDEQVLNNLVDSSKFATNQDILDLSKRIFFEFMHRPSILNSNIDKNSDFSLNDEWFYQSVEHLHIENNLEEWILDKSRTKTIENNPYHLFDFYDFEQKQCKRKKPLKSLEPSLVSRIDIEHGLTTIYACYTVLNMIKIGLCDPNNLFPLENFGDYAFLTNLLKLLNDIEIDIDEKNDQIHLLINLILKNELKHLLKLNTTTDGDLLKANAPLFYHLQKNAFIQSIQLISKPSLLDETLNRKRIRNDQQPDLEFILKIIKFFIELITDKSFVESNQIESMISFMFPVAFINVIFDLFLLVPLHQSKITIIRLFSILLQTSEKFQLNEEIQHFCVQLFIELSSKTSLTNDSLIKQLRLALADFIFILMNKLKQCSFECTDKIESIESKLPKNIENLFTVINVINIWTNSTKDKVLPESFFEKSAEFSDGDIQLTQDEFNQSNIHFDSNTDQDLITFINNDQSISDSFSTFLDKLPKESEPNSTFFKNYLSLSTIPMDSIRYRAQFFYLFNKFIEESLSLIDFGLPLGESFLTDKIRKVKPYLLLLTKFQLFQESLEKTESEYSNDCIVVNFDTIKASTDNQNSENTMFSQAYQQLRNNAHLIFRRPNAQLWSAQYIGMHSTDHGGPYRDSITQICSDICSNRLSLFILCPNGRTSVGLNRDCWIPNIFPPNETIPNKIRKEYNFVGQLMGMAIRKKHYLNIKFPLLLWKKLLQEPITIGDIEAIDSQSFKIINEAEKNIEQIKSFTTNDDDDDVNSLFSSLLNELHFDVVSSSGETYELIPGGSNISITVENFKQYCSSYRQYRLNEFNRQIEAIRQGLYSIVPAYYLSLFTAKELEEAVCGKDRIDIELLKRNTCYGGDYSRDSPLIERFWTVLNDMFNEDQRKAFLVFVWGRSTLPIHDDDFESKLTITDFEVYNGEVDRTLPRSHTCFFTIDLPAYSSTDVMYDRLNYAISCCLSIDGDGTVNEGLNSESIDFDDSSDEE